MSNPEVAAPQPPSFAKGLVAGLVGGLVGAVAMALAERMFPPQAPSHQSPVGEDIPWGYGITVGAAYGALAEHFPAATAKEGASFGMALEALTQETAALGLADGPEITTTRERASEMTSHVVFGVTTEWVRRLVRKML
jgi:putative membrane protein